MIIQVGFCVSFVYRLLKGSDDVTKNKTDVLDKNDTLHK